MIKVDVKNKVVILTGASSGIGLATARLLSEHGAKLALVARSKDKLEKLAGELPDSLAVPADMTKVDKVKGMVERTLAHFGRVEVLVNDAGQGYDAPVERIRVDTLSYIFQLDVVGPVVAMQEVIPLMRKQGGGVIVNVSSGTALMTLPNMSPYSSLKGALAMISLTAREELKEDGIVVSVVYPYVTLTDFEKNTIKDPSLLTQSEEGGEFDELPHPPDTAEHMAQKILEAIQTGEAEVFAHDWLKKARD